MSADDYIKIIVALGGFVTILAAQIILIIGAINRRADEAERSRREIAQPQQVANAVVAQQQPAGDKK